MFWIAEWAVQVIPRPRGGSGRKEAPWMLLDSYRHMHAQNDFAGLAELAEAARPFTDAPEWADALNCIGLHRIIRARGHEDLFLGASLIKAALGHALPRSIDHARRLGNYTWALLTLGLWRDALTRGYEWLNTPWLRLPPEMWPRMRWMLALSTMHLCQWEESIAHWQTAADGFYDTDAGCLSGVVVGWAATLAYLQRVDEARAVLESTPEVAPYHAHAMSVDALLRLQGGRPDEAYEIARVAAVDLERPTMYGLDRWAAAGTHITAARSARSIGKRVEEAYHRTLLAALIGPLPRSPLIQARVAEEIEGSCVA